MKTKIVLLLVLFVFSLIVAVFIGKGTTDNPAQTTSLSPTPGKQRPILPTPRINTGSSYSFSALPNQTTEVSSYFVSEFSINKELSRIAVELGFTGVPIQTESTRGTYLDWSGPQGTLTFVPDRRTIIFTSSITPSSIGTQTSDALVSFATKRLTSLSLPNIPANIVVSGIEYFAPKNNEPNRLSSPFGATVFQVNFEYKLGDIPIYSDKLGSTSDVWVRIDAAGSVVSFSIVPMPLFVSNKAISVLSIEEAAQQLITNKTPATSIVFSESGEELTYLSTPPASIAVKSGVLAYYYNNKLSTLNPVFVFVGEGVVSNNKVKTFSIVSAAR